MNSSLPKQVSELIERFERNETSYTSGQYNETQLRQEFINPVRTYHHFAPAFFRGPRLGCTDCKKYY